jgi:predicted DNA-binding protein
MKRVNYHLPEQTIRALKALSKKMGVSVAELIRRAVDSYLKL